MPSRGRRGPLLLLGLACLAARAAAAPAGESPGPGIANRTALSEFSGKLRELSTGRRSRVTIVHLGDSHVQGELLTGQLRRRLQARFGSAGRGIVMPWDAAGTNGPSDVTSVSDADWNLSRVPSPDPHAPPGIAGMTVWTDDGGFVLKLAVRSDDPADRFDRVTILSEGGPGWTTIAQVGHPNPMILESSRPVTRDIRHIVRKGDTLYGLSRHWGCTVNQIRKWNRLPSTIIHPGTPLIVRRITGRRAPVDRSRFAPGLRFNHPDAPGPFLATIDLPGMTDHLFLQGSGTATGSARLYGIVLERRDLPGVVYHSIGVNGAEFRDYTAAPLFWGQLPLLKPDLLVVTLGTNDSVVTGFRKEDFQAHLDAFLDRITATLGAVPVLLMSPPDHRGSRGRRLPAADTVREVIRDTSLRRGVGWWDTASAMGGDGSILAWKKRGWAGPDLVHLTPEGYRKLADLFVEDLLQKPAPAPTGEAFHDAR